MYNQLERIFMFVPEVKEVFMHSTVDREWYYKDLIAKDTILLITGNPKSGKSTFCMTLLDAITSNKPFFDLPFIAKTIPKVLYINYEMSDSDLRMRVKPLDLKNISLIRNGNLCDLSVPEHLEKLRTICNDYDIIAFDTLSRCGSFDENSSTSMGNLMKFFISLRDQKKCIILVHHNSKTGKTRGSSVIDAQVDSKLCLAKCGGKFIATMEYSRCSDLSSTFAYTIKQENNSLLLQKVQTNKYDYVLLAIKQGLDTSSKLVRGGVLSTKNVSAVLKEMEKNGELSKVREGKTKFLKINE